MIQLEDSKFEHIQIGEYKSYVAYVRYHSLYLYDEEIPDFDINNEEEDNISFFQKLNSDFLFELYKHIELPYFEQTIIQNLKNI